MRRAKVALVMLGDLHFELTGSNISIIEKIHRPT